jgi:unsaturated rhamnogalacturonyl hydrolase
MTARDPRIATPLDDCAVPAFAVGVRSFAAEPGGGTMMREVNRQRLHRDSCAAWRRWVENPLLVLAGLGLVASAAHAQTGGSMDRWNGIPTSASISATEQAGIDEDILRQHFGDIPVDPGPKAHLSAALNPAAVDAAVRKVADWELKRAEPYMNPSWTWAVLGTGFMAASRELNDPRYRDAMQKMAEKYHWELSSEDRVGRGWPDNNDQAMGQTYLELYFVDPSPQKIDPVRKGLDGLIGVPQPPPDPDQFQQLWWWCDSLFMGPPLWARMSAATHDPKYLRYADDRWWEVTDKMYSPAYHLFYRDKIYIGVMDPAMKPIFWSRGNGWVMGGLARTLESMPKDFPDRPRYEKQMREMARELASIQDPANGLWHSDLLDPADYPQPEISGSTLIAFGLAWGINNGVLDRTTYLPVVEKAWRGLLNQIYADGRLGNVQQTDEAPEHYLPQSSFNFGVGGFLLAGEEVAKLSEHHD